MRCKDAQEMLVDTTREGCPSGVREHLDQCPACRSYAADQLILAEGMKLLAQENIPESSAGFCTRLVRRISDERIGSAQFLEYAGRRVVYATLVLVFFLLLAMIVPSSGPVRRESNIQTYPPQQEAETVTAGNYSVSLESVPAVPVMVDLTTNAGNN
jgi:predicted anti-sigma-YlaC factor YlaD